MKPRSQTRDTSLGFRVVLVLLCVPGAIVLMLLGVSEKEPLLFVAAGCIFLIGLCPFLPPPFSSWIGRLIALLVASISVWFVFLSLTDEDESLGGALRFLLFFGAPAFAYLFLGRNPFTQGRPDAVDGDDIPPSKISPDTVTEPRGTGMCAEPD